MISAKYIADLLQTSLKGGIWISFVGDSLMRGVFLKSVSFLSVRSKHIIIDFNYSTYHNDHFVCCDSLHVEGKGNELDRCEVLMHKADETGVPLPDAVATEFLARRGRAAGVVPVCVSWQWNRGAAGLLPLFAEFESTHARTGVRPATVSFNPGLHGLVQGFDLERLVHEVSPRLPPLLPPRRPGIVRPDAAQV